MILFKDSEGPDQTAQIHCLQMPWDTFSHDAVHIIFKN